MAVYREGYYALDLINKSSVQIFPDAADFGAPTKKDDQIWNSAKQLVEWYGDQSTKKEYSYSTGKSCECEFTLIDEWAVSDERKTEVQATEKYKIYFTTCTSGRCKNMDGYITITKLN